MKHLSGSLKGVRTDDLCDIGAAGRAVHNSGQPIIPFNGVH